MAGMSFREIGRRLGGSTTLVTHYYPTQAALIRDVATAGVDAWMAVLDVINEKYDDPVDRLNAMLFQWLLPISGEDLANEKTRINLVAAGLQGAETQEALDIWEDWNKRSLRPILSEFLPASRVDECADLLRVTFNGLALSTVEHPDYWTPRRQYKALEAVARGLGLPATAPKRVSRVAS